jgi:hypothetical protein
MLCPKGKVIVPEDSLRAMTSAEFWDYIMSNDDFPCVSGRQPMQCAVIPPWPIDE